MRALLAVFAVAGGSVLWWLADQLIARDVLRSTHVVYFLIDRHGRVLYVGSTNDWQRRFLEHTDPDEPGEWRRQIHDMVIVRHCRSLRQARRVERRMIRALVDGCRWRMCGPVWNSALAGRAPWSVSRAVWLTVYRVNGVLWPVTRWHAPNPAARWQQPVERGTNGVTGEGDGSGWRVPPVADPVSDADGPQWAPLGALPPADHVSTADTRADHPSAGPGRPHLTVVATGQGEGQPTETAKERRTRLNREYKQASRARYRERKQVAE